MSPTRGSFFYGAGLFALVLAALLYRSQLNFKDPGYVLYGDSSSYIAGALGILQGKWSLLHLSRTPGYPFFYALHLWLAMTLRLHPLDMNTISRLVVQSQTLLVLLTAGFTADIGRRLFHSPWLALLTFGMIVFSGDLLLYERAILSEILFTFMLTLSAWLSLRSMERSNRLNVLLTGLAWIGTALVRPIGLFAAAAAGFVLFWRQGWRSLLYFTLPLLLVSAIWVGHNIREYHYWGFAAGVPCNQLAKLVDLIQTTPSRLPAARQAILNRYNTYASDDPNRYLAVYEGLQDLTHLNGSDNPAWLDFNRISSVMINEIWQKQPMAVIQKTWQELCAIFQPTATLLEARSLWLATLFLGLITLCAMFFYSRHPSKAFAVLCLLIAVTQLAGYPLFINWQERFRLPIQPLLTLYMLYGVRQAGAWLHMRLHTPKQQT